MIGWCTTSRLGRRLDDDCGPHCGNYARVWLDKALVIRCPVARVIRCPVPNRSQGAELGTGYARLEQVDEEAADHKGGRGYNHKNFRRVIASKNAEHGAPSQCPTPKLSMPVQ